MVVLDDATPSAIGAATVMSEDPVAVAAAAYLTSRGYVVRPSTLPLPPVGALTTEDISVLRHLVANPIQQDAADKAGYSRSQFGRRVHAIERTLGASSLFEVVLLADRRGVL